MEGLLGTKRMENAHARVYVPALTAGNRRDLHHGGLSELLASRGIRGVVDVGALQERACKRVDRYFARARQLGSANEAKQQLTERNELLESQLAKALDRLALVDENWSEEKEVVKPRRSLLSFFRR